MPTFDYTVELERSILKMVISSAIQARRYIHRLKPHLFTTNERKFILDVLLDALNSTGQLATRKVFEYEVSKRVEDSDQQYFIGEWNLVEGCDTQDPPEVILKKLEEAHTGRELLRIGEEVDVLLENGQIEEALTHLKGQALSVNTNQGDKPMVELTDYHAREQMIIDKRDHPEKYRGLRTGFKPFDDATGGLYAGELTLLAAPTGTGKSTICRQLELNIVMLNPGKNVLHIANEEYLEQVQHKFDANCTEIPYLDFKRGQISDEDFEKWREHMQDWKDGKWTAIDVNGNPFVPGRIFVKEVPAFTEVTLVEQAFRECEAKGIQIHCVVIDHLPHVKPIQKTWGENDEQKKAAADCKELARWLKIPVVVPTQAATEVLKKQERGKRGNKQDVYGSKGQVHVANTFILITESGKDEEQVDLEEWERDVFWTVDIKKNRDGPPFWFRARHRVKIGRVEVIAGQEGKGSPPDEAKAEKEVKHDIGVAHDDEAAEAEAVLAEDEEDVVESSTPKPKPPPKPQPVQQPGMLPASTLAKAKAIAKKVNATKTRSV